MNKGGLCYRYFSNSKNTIIVQLVTAFAFGVVFSPWTTALLVFIFTIVFLEYLYLYSADFIISYQTLEGRAGVILASILGFLVGRTIIGFDDPFHLGNPQVNRALPSMKIKLKMGVDQENLRLQNLL